MWQTFCKEEGKGHTLTSSSAPPPALAPHHPHESPGNPSLGPAHGVGGPGLGPQARVCGSGQSPAHPHLSQPQPTRLETPWLEAAGSLTRPWPSLWAIFPRTPQERFYFTSYDPAPAGEGLAQSSMVGKWSTQNADPGLRPPNPRPLPQATLCLVGITCGPSPGWVGSAGCRGLPSSPVSTQAPHSRPCHRRRQSRPHTGGDTGGPRHRGRQVVSKGSR